MDTHAEIILWGLPAGETDPIHQVILSTQCQSQADAERIKKQAAADGWHSFRIQVIDGSKPDFVGAINL